MSIVLVIVRVWVSSLFFYAASLKVIDYRATGRSVGGYDLRPGRLAGAAGVVLPLAEAAAGVLVLGGWVWPAGPALTLLLGLSFCYAAWSALHRGLDTDCGCAGAKSGRLTWVTFGRALLVSGSAVILLAAGAGTHIPAGWVVPAAALSAVPAAWEWRRRRVQTRHLRAQKVAVQAEVSRQYALLSSPQAP